jgi:hypothetical protein
MNYSHINLNTLANFNKKIFDINPYATLKEYNKIAPGDIINIFRDERLIPCGTIYNYMMPKYRKTIIHEIIIMLLFAIFISIDTLIGYIMILMYIITNIRIYGIIFIFSTSILCILIISAVLILHYGQRNIKELPCLNFTVTNSKIYIEKYQLDNYNRIVDNIKNNIGDIMHYSNKINIDYLDIVISKKYIIMGKFKNNQLIESVKIYKYKIH